MKTTAKGVRASRNPGISGLSPSRRRRSPGPERRRYCPCLERLEERCVLDGGPAASPPGGGILTASPPVNASQWANNQAETTIAIDPTNPQRLFTSAVSFSNANGLFAAYSTDGGVNWNRRIMAMGVATGNDSLPAAADDPQAAFDQFGNLFLVYRTLGQVQQGTSTAIGNNTLTDTNPGQPWATNMWQNHTITVMPPGADPQTRTIVSNTGTVITVNAA